MYPNKIFFKQKNVGLPVKMKDNPTKEDKISYVSRSGEYFNIQSETSGGLVVKPYSLQDVYAAKVLYVCCTTGADTTKGHAIAVQPADKNVSTTSGASGLDTQRIINKLELAATPSGHTLEDAEPSMLSEEDGIENTEYLEYCYALYRNAAFKQEIQRSIKILFGELQDVNADISTVRACQFGIKALLTLIDNVKVMHDSFEATREHDSAVEESRGDVERSSDILPVNDEDTEIPTP